MATCVPIRASRITKGIRDRYRACPRKHSFRTERALPWHIRCFVRCVKGRWIALGAMLAATLGLLFAGGWARGASEEADALGALLGHAHTSTVNDASLASVNHPDEEPARDEPTGDAHDFVRRRHERIRALLRDEATPARVTTEIDIMLGQREIARAALGDPCPAAVPACTNHWDALTPDQRQEVTDLFRRLVSKNIQKHARKTLAYEVAFASAKDIGSGRAKVRTEAKSPSREEATQIDYVVSTSGNDHHVVDVIVEGSSFTKNYYDQLHRMLITPDQGYAFMVSRMEAKIARP